MLNLFCYTGSFSVYAAAGGAAEIVSVDLSRTYLKWATENMELNGFYDAAKHFFLHEDVKQYLLRLPAGYFDLVLALFPPTFQVIPMYVLATAIVFGFALTGILYARSTAAT